MTMNLSYICSIEFLRSFDTVALYVAKSNIISYLRTYGYSWVQNSTKVFPSSSGCDIIWTIAPKNSWCVRDDSVKARSGIHVNISGWLVRRFIFSFNDFDLMLCLSPIMHMFLCTSMIILEGITFLIGSIVASSENEFGTSKNWIPLFFIL